MKIYPKDSFEIDSPMTPEQAFTALDAVVEPKRRFRFTAWKKFEGNLSGMEFKISRLIGYRNSFLPVIEGKISPSLSGCTVAVTMRLAREVSAFMLLWLSVAMILMFNLLRDISAGKSDTISDVFIPLGAILFAVLLCSILFWWEARKGKAELLELFNGVERE